MADKLRIKEATDEHKYSQVSEVEFEKPQPYPPIRVLPASPNTSVADKLRIKEATDEHRCAKISKVEFEKPQPSPPIRVLHAWPNTSVADKLRTKEATVEHRCAKISKVEFKKSQLYPLTRELIQQIQQEVFLRWIFSEFQNKISQVFSPVLPAVRS